MPRKLRPLLKMSAEEFARRLKQGTDDADKRFALFLGAGASVSSGIPDAGSLVKEQWLPRLRDLRAPDRNDLDSWAKEQFPKYSPKRPAIMPVAMLMRLGTHTGLVT